MRDERAHPHATADCCFERPFELSPIEPEDDDVDGTFCPLDGGEHRGEAVLWLDDEFQLGPLLLLRGPVHGRMTIGVEPKDSIRDVVCLYFERNLHLIGDFLVRRE